MDFFVFMWRYICVLGIHNTEQTLNANNNLKAIKKYKPHITVS